MIPFPRKFERIGATTLSTDRHHKHAIVIFRRYKRDQTLFNDCIEGTSYVESKSEALHTICGHLTDILHRSDMSASDVTAVICEFSHS